MTDFSYMGIADSISIHAPRTGSDGGCRRGGGSHHISIHAPRTGSDVSRGLSGVLHRQFQSTLPARGATSPVGYQEFFIANFNPRSPHGERRPSSMGITLRRIFQSTLPARGATRERSRFCPVCVKFQSTLPARGATVSGGGTRQWQTRFQSTLPARGATYESTWRLEDELFQSTLPARGATITTAGRATPVIFQSTLPARGATCPLV